jgi:hypothetical protein
MSLTKDIEEFKGLYTISESGIVTSLRTGKILNHFKSHRGYHRVLIRINNKAHNRAVHRLVAMAFIPNPLALPEVNHKNGIKSDNGIENLEWVSRSDNQYHAYANGLRKSPKYWTGKKFTAEHRQKISQGVKRILEEEKATA